MAVVGNGPTIPEIIEWKTTFAHYIWRNATPFMQHRDDGSNFDWIRKHRSAWCDGETSHWKTWELSAPLTFQTIFLTIWFDSGRMKIKYMEIYIESGIRKFQRIPLKPPQVFSDRWRLPGTFWRENYLQRPNESKIINFAQSASISKWKVCTSVEPPSAEFCEINL